MATEYLIEFGPNAKTTDVSEHSRGVLKAIMEKAAVFKVTITSTARGPYDQARVMYDNLEAYGVAAQKALYANPGDAVIDVYAAAKAAGKDKDTTIALMKAKIIALGPTKVSNHAADLSKLNVFDVGPGGIPAEKKQAWQNAIKTSAGVKKYIFPPADPGYHFEIEQPSSS